MATDGDEVVGGKYRIEALIAESAHSRIYRAVHTSLDRPLALRRLRDDAAERHRLDVLTEARLCAGLSHPNVLDVYEMGEDRGPFVAMELLEGVTLRARLSRSKRAPLEEIARIGAGILGAVAAAHRADMVHPALSPANVFIAELRGGHIAKLSAFRSRRRGDPLDDLHAVGTTMYEAMTGMRPPDPTDSRLPPGPSELREDLGLDADAFASRALAATRDARFQSADEMYDAWSSIEAFAPHLRA